MLIAVPEQVWAEYETASPAALPKASFVSQPTPNPVASRHVSTARILIAGYV
jgi:hypothetical protein